MNELELRAVWSPPLKNLSIRLTTGLHVVLGADADGTASLVELCAGVRSPRRGAVLLDGEPPSSSPRLRRRIASLLPTEEAPVHDDLLQWLGALAELRGFSTERALSLLAFQLAPKRAGASLSSVERRQLALAVALAQPDPPLVTLHEPLAAAGALGRARVVARIQELASQATVLVTTLAVADAQQLGGVLYVMERGVLVRQPEHAWPAALTPGLDARLFIEADAPRELLARLARDPEVGEARYDGAQSIELRGPDLERLALAVSRAAVDAASHVRSLHSIAPDLEAVHGASAGLAHAAYRAAQQPRPSGPRAVEEASPGAPAAAAGPPSPDSTTP